MSDDPQAQHHDLDEPATSHARASHALGIEDQGFELSGRWIRVSLADLEHIGRGGTPQGMVGSANARAVHGTIGGAMVVRPARRRLPILLVTPVLLALITWAWQMAGAANGGAARASMRARVNLIYDTSVLEPEHGARLQRQWGEQLEPQPEPLSARARVRTLRVRVTAFDEELHNYEIHLELSDGAQIHRLLALRCDGCSEARLVALTVERARQLLTPTPRQRPRL